MADADDKLDFCKQALGELGTRSTITSLDPPDGSQEAYYCGLFFNGTRDQVLRAAHWNFAASRDRAPLWKAQPGTPENGEIPTGLWNNRNVQPPWLYSYFHKDADIIQIRRVRGQQSSVSGVSYFSMFTANAGITSPVPFEVAADFLDRLGRDVFNCQKVTAVTIDSPGVGYQGDDDIVLSGTAASLMGQPVTLRVRSVDINGGVVSAPVRCGGTFTGSPISITQTSTTGNGTGFSCTPIVAAYGSQSQKVILTNAQDVIIDYTTNLVDIARYDPLFSDAFMLALEGKLALALIGDRALYAAKLQEANAAIINARVRDGNEGLTVYDSVPDWMQARGISAAGGPSGWYNPPYGPLFAV